MPILPLRIAILECDTPLDRTRAQYGTYGGVFESLLRSGADALGYPELSSTKGLIVTKWDVVTKQEYPIIDDIDAILITGSRFNSFDRDPWILKLVDYTKGVLAQYRVRVIGVCFGHQIVGIALGVEVARSEKGWEASVTPMSLSKRGQEIFKSNALELHQMHRDVVYEYPIEVEQLGYTEKCTVQSMYIAKRLITVQGHPEFTEEIVREILGMRHELGILDDDTFDDAMTRVDKSQDGVVVAQAFLRFLLD